MKRVKFTPVYIGVATAIATLATATVAQAQTTLPEVKVIEFRGEQVDSIKYSRDLQETPRIITILTEDLLQEQGVSTLKDALRNQPGISMQHGEGSPPAGDQFKIRGFNARDDINVNSVRDMGSYYRDPFFVEQLEIIKGPNSAFSGRGSVGGTVNFVTKKPLPETATRTNDGARLELSLGTASLKRATLDLNKPIDLNSAVRINLMAHDSNIPGRDVVKESRQGLYAAYTWGFIGPTQFTVDYLHLRQRDLPDYGLPIDRQNRLGQGRKVPGDIKFSNFYGYDNDFMHVDVNQLGLTVEHALHNGARIKNQTRLSHVHNDYVVSAPRINNDPPNFTVKGDHKGRDQKDTGFNNQTDYLFSFDTGGVSHDMVVGVELGQYKYKNKKRFDGPPTILTGTRDRDRVNPARATAAQTYLGINHHFETKEVGVYVLDTMALNPDWDLHAGIRWDEVRASALSTRASDTSSGSRKKDSEVSYSLGLVRKLDNKSSVYASYGTAFKIGADFDRNAIQMGGASGDNVVKNSGVFNASPEKVQSYELGIKRQLDSGLDLNAALFRTEATRARLPSQAENIIADVQYHVNGLELTAAGNVNSKTRLYAGYVYMDSKVTKTAPAQQFAVGQKLGGTPTHSFNIFATYDVTPQWTLGGGLQHVSKHFTHVNHVQPVDGSNAAGEIPAFTVADLYAAYKISQQTQLRLNVYNVTNKKYLLGAAEGAAQAVPGKARQFVATLRHDF
jgi:catecholate siderophore receptor